MKTSAKHFDLAVRL